MRATRPFGVVLGSVIMKNMKTSTSGEVTRIHQKYRLVIGPRCQRAVIACPVAARMPMLAANETQKPIAIPSRFSPIRIQRPPRTMIASASAIQGDIGPHQKSSGAARSEPRTRKQRTSPKLDGLKTWLPRHLITYLDKSETAAVPAKIHQPFVLHQSPCWVPGTRKTKATPFPVRRALAGHMTTCCRTNAIPTSSTAHVPSAIRICAIDRSKSNAVWPRTCSEMITAARCSRGSLNLGRSTGYDVPRSVNVGRPAGAAAVVAITSCYGAAG